MADAARRSAPEEVLDRLGRDVRDTTASEVSARAHAAGKQRLLAALAAEGARVRGRSVRWVVPASAAGALVATAAAILIFLGGRQPAALTWRAEGVALEGGYAAVPAGGPAATLRFSDGSDVVLEPGSRGRIGPLGPREAHVVLESGRARAHLGPVGRMAWFIDVGPFAISTSEAALDVAWTPADQVMDVRLSSGKAVVRGSVASDGMTLQPGHEHLVAQVQQGVVRLEGDDGSPDVPAGPAPPAPAPLVSAEHEALDRPGPAPSAHAPRTSWTQRVAGGDFDGVIDEAQAGGIEATLGRSSLADLVALADAARYRGHSELARRTLLAERARFSGSGDARTAAFLLGRIAEDAGHSPGDALTWYERYLAESPRGPFVAEAMGRRMNALATTSGRDAARPAAEQYLRRFPRGPYAPIARELLEPAAPR